jgi:predicted signal transduction protein with EAL and GGDEF domain
LTELAEHGCDQAQGYHLSRPVPAAELDNWLDRRHQQNARGSLFGDTTSAAGGAR